MSATTPSELLAEVAHVGGRVAFKPPDTLSVDLPADAKNWLLPLLKQHKPELVEYLRQQAAQVSRPASARTGTDPYAERMQVDLAAINRPDYPAGTIPWLGEAHQDLYQELTSRIPDEIDLAWRLQVPPAEFDAILARLVSTHRQACALYRAAQPDGTKLRQKSPVASERRGRLGGDDGHR